MSMTKKDVSPDHHVAYDDIVRLVGKHKDRLSPVELLAIAANMIGKLIALQDQRTITPDKAMEIVFWNIEEGNQQAVFEMSETKGRA